MLSTLLCHVRLRSWNQNEVQEVHKSHVNQVRITPELPRVYTAWPGVWRLVALPKYLRRYTCPAKHRHRSCHPATPELSTSTGRRSGKTWQLGVADHTQRWDQCTWGRQSCRAYLYISDISLYIYILYIYIQKKRLRSWSQVRAKVMLSMRMERIQAARGPVELDPSALRFLHHPTFAVHALRISELVSSVATSAISTMFSMKTCGNVGVGSWTSSMKTWPHGHMAKQRWFIFPYLPQDVFPSAASFMLYPGMLMPWKRGSLGACTSDGSRPWGKVLPAAPATGGCSIIAPMISSDWWNILVTGKFSMGNPWKSRLSGRLSHFCRFSEPIWGSNFWRSHGIGKPAVSGAKSSPNPLGSSKNSLSRLSQHGTCPIKGCSRNLFFYDLLKPLLDDFYWFRVSSSFNKTAHISHSASGRRLEALLGQFRHQLPRSRVKLREGDAFPNLRATTAATPGARARRSGWFQPRNIDFG